MWAIPDRSACMLCVRNSNPGDQGPCWRSSTARFEGLSMCWRSMTAHYFSTTKGVNSTIQLQPHVAPAISAGAGIFAYAPCQQSHYSKPAHGFNALSRWPGRGQHQQHIREQAHRQVLTQLSHVRHQLPQLDARASFLGDLTYSFDQHQT